MYRYLGIILVLLCSCSGPRPEKPNVLFIMVDDLRTELGCYGRSEIKSPNIDALAEEGILFTNSYCNMPVCGASRASILSGMRATPSRFVNWYTRLEDDAPHSISIPEHFKYNGYTTVSLGKIFHHADDSPGSWSKPPRRPEHPIGKWWAGRGYLDRENQVIAESSPGGYASFFEIGEDPEAKYPDEILAEMAVEQLGDLSMQKSPFFLAVGFFKPHLPFVAPAKYWDYYSPSEDMLAENHFRPENAPDEAFYSMGQLNSRTSAPSSEEFYDTYPTKELRSYTGIPETGPIHDSIAIKLVHGYYASVSFIDDMIGRVLASLKELELDDNTIVILMGDHGWHLGEHGLWCKHCNFKNVLQTPLMIRIPWIEGEKESDALVEFVDIYPTLCELCGLDQPDHLEGSSLMPLLYDPDLDLKDAVFTRYMAGNTIINRQYAYTEWYDNDKNLRGNMLYDHEIDPEENVNISGRPENEKRISEFRKLLFDTWPELKRDE